MKKQGLHGQEAAVSHANGKGSKGYFYRERIEGTKKYRQKRIEGAENLMEAVKIAIDTALETRDEQPSSLNFFNKYL